MNSKLFIGNLPYSINTDELSRVFSQAGSVTEAVVIFDKRSQRSKGYGFVHMASEEDAQKAIEMFNGTDMQGRTIIVTPAISKGPITLETPALQE